MKKYIVLYLKNSLITIECKGVNLDEIHTAMDLFKKTKSNYLIIEFK